MSKSHQLGNWGEEIALSFLEICGYVCLEKRYRKQTGEIDLIVRRDREIVFVEVKTRASGSMAPPEAWINGLKISRMKKTARHWIFENAPTGVCNFRFDAISVEFSGHNRGMNVRHFTGIT